MVFIQGGTFELGATPEQEGAWNREFPMHTVELDSYYLAKYPITFAQYDAYCKLTGNALPNDRGWGRGKRPAIHISWYDAILYCNWLSEQVGLNPCYQIHTNIIDTNNICEEDERKWLVECDFTQDGFRLPTEAEWEYAARERGKRQLLGNGKSIADPEEINFNPKWEYSYRKEGIYRAQTVPVGSFPPNALGLYEMSGNVTDWCWDWCGTYPQESVSNPRGAQQGFARVRRGGAWNFPATAARTAFRLRANPAQGGKSLGFRLARTFLP